ARTPPGDHDGDDVLVGKDVVPTDGLAGEPGARTPDLSRPERPVQVRRKPVQERFDRIALPEDHGLVLVGWFSGRLHVDPDEPQGVADALDQLVEPLLRACQRSTSVRWV